MKRKDKKFNPIYLILVILFFIVCIVIFFKKDDIIHSYNYSILNTDSSAQIVTTYAAETKEVKQEEKQETMKELDYKWSYDNRDWTYKLKIPDSYYDRYKNVSRKSMGVNNYSAYVTDTSDDQWVNSLAKAFIKEGKNDGYSDTKIIELMISFVQSLNYLEDKATTGFDEYPKFPLETLYDKGGDCEDTSILLVSLIRETGYGVALLQFEGHMAVGLKCSENMPGSYFTYNNERYYYVETSSKGWKIGQLPDEIKGQSAEIFPV